jgi:PAS domain S-box-containing protein
MRLKGTMRGAHSRQWEDRELRLVLDAIPVMAWTVRPNGVVDFVNQHWLRCMGLTFAEEIAEPRRPMHPEDVQRVMETWVACMAAGHPFEDDMRLQQADGQYRWFRVITVPLRDEKHNIVKWYGSCIDIEDRKRAEEALHKSHEQLRTLAAQVQRAVEELRIRVAREVHDELDEPLTAIRTNLDSLTHEQPVDKGQQFAGLVKTVDEMIQAVGRISTELRSPIPDALRLVPSVESAGLTDRESEVLRLMSSGLRNKEIGSRLGITEQTAQWHVKNILLKLKVHDRTEAVTVAVRRGIINLY